MTDQEITALGLKYFSPATDPNISWPVVDPLALKSLDIARDDAGTAMKINSNYRTLGNPAGFSTDAHRDVPCTAFDIDMERSDGKWDSVKAFKVIPALIKNGFNRIGINMKNNSLHADMSKTRPQNVIFME